MLLCSRSSKRCCCALEVLKTTKECCCWSSFRNSKKCYRCVTSYRKKAKNVAFVLDVVVFVALWMIKKCCCCSRSFRNHSILFNCFSSSGNCKRCCCCFRSSRKGKDVFIPSLTLYRRLIFHLKQKFLLSNWSKVDL